MKAHAAMVSALCALVLSSYLSVALTARTAVYVSVPSHLLTDPVAANNSGLSTNAVSHSSLSNCSDVFHSERLLPEPASSNAGHAAALFGVVVTALLLASGAGIGGGAVLVPTFVLLGGFTASTSVALSNVTILGGSIANFVCNVRKVRGDGATPLIDWDLVVIMEPSTIIGALVGGYLNKFLPAWTSITMMALLLTLVAWNLLSKALHTYSKETLQLQSPHLVEPLLDLEAAEACSPLPPSPPQKLKNIDVDTVCIAQQQAADDYVDKKKVIGPCEEEQLSVTAIEASSREPAMVECERPAALVPHHFAWGRFGTLAALMLAVAACDVGKGAVHCGSLLYWLATCAIIPPCAAVVLTMRHLLLKRQHTPAGQGQGQLHWTPASTLVYPLICTLAGVVAGLFGVGGGIVKAPLMLELGVPPEVAAATSSTMILFTSMSASAVYVHFGSLPLALGGVCAVVGLITTLAGQALTTHLVSVLQRRSIIIFFMVALMVMAAGVMYYETVLAWLDLAVHPDAIWHFGRLCGG